METGWWRLLDHLKNADAPAWRAIHGMRHQVRKGACCAVHSHRELEIVYHPTGSGFTRLAGDREIRFAAGSFVLYAPDQGHDQVMDGKGEDACLQIEVPAILRTVLSGGLHMPAFVDPLVVAEMETLTRDRIWTDASERTVMHLRATAVLLSLVQAAFADVHRESLPRTQGHVAKADSYLRDHFQTIGSLQEVSSHVGISHSRLRHLFQEYRGMSMIRRLNEVRLERARSLLIHSRLPIKQVASLSGFRDEYYFSAVFRRAQQVAPSIYREKGGKPLPRTKSARYRV
jgi:AraC-like DNA-binding protein